MSSLGDFLNFVPTNLRTKVIQIFADFLGYFEKLYFLVKTAVNIFGQLLVDIGLLLVCRLVTLLGVHKRLRTWSAEQRV